MPTLLREIKRSYWRAQADDAPRPASSLRNMAVDDKKRLSVWWLEDENREENLKRLIVALTIQGGHCEQFSYAVVEQDVVADLGLNIVETPGRTVDSAANLLHRDVVDPSVEQVCALTLRLTVADTIQPKEVGQLIVDRIKAGSLPRADLPEEIEEKLIGWHLLEREAHSEQACEEARNVLKLALDEWQNALTAYRETIEAAPTSPDHANLDKRLVDAAKSAKDALGHARRIWRSHPPPPENVNP